MIAFAKVSIWPELLIFLTTLRELNHGYNLEYIQVIQPQFLQFVRESARSLVKHIRHLSAW